MHRGLIIVGGLATVLGFGLLVTTGWGHGDVSERQEPAVRPDSPSAEGVGLQAGLAAETRGDLVAAEEAYREAAGSGPDQAEALYHLAVVQRADGRIEEAVESLERLVAADGSFVAARLLLAECLAQLDRAAEARRHYEAVVDMRPLGVDVTAVEEAIEALD